MRLQLLDLPYRDWETIQQANFSAKMFLPKAMKRLLRWLFEISPSWLITYRDWETP